MKREFQGNAVGKVCHYIENMPEEHIIRMAFGVGGIFIGFSLALFGAAIL